MFRRLFTAVSAVSLLLCLASVALLLELRPTRGFEFSLRGRRWQVQFGGQRVWVDDGPQRRLDSEPAVSLARQRMEEAHRAYLAADERLERARLSDSPTDELRTAHRQAADAWSAASRAYSDSEWNSLRSPGVSYGVSYAAAAGVTSLLPLAWLVRFAVRASRPWRRYTRGLCPRCGYDLRETRRRCPECGSAPWEA
jgi:hypothetical protein